MLRRWLVQPQHAPGDEGSPSRSRWGQCATGHAHSHFGSPL